MYEAFKSKTTQCALKAISLNPLELQTQAYLHVRTGVTKLFSLRAGLLRD